MHPHQRVKNGRNQTATTSQTLFSKYNLVGNKLMRINFLKLLFFGFSKKSFPNKISELRRIITCIFIRQIKIVVIYARTSGERGDIMCGDITLSSYLRDVKLSLRLLWNLRLLFTCCFSTNIRILSSATSTVSSSIFAKQTLNQPGSEQ